MAYPKDKLGTGEKEVYLARKHGIVLVKAAIQWILLFIVAIVLAIALNTVLTLDQTVETILSFVALAAAFIAFIAFGISYLVWRSEEFIITNERVIQVEGIINKNEYGTSLDKINDIETYQSLFGRMLGYGTVRLLTGSDTGINTLDYLAKPYDFKKVVLNAKNGFYGDASDLARAPRQTVQQDAPRRPVAPEEQIFNVPPQLQQQPQYQNDPRGYAPPRSQPQPQQVPYNGYAAQSPQPMTAQQIADTLQQLARLRDSGVITEAEFQAKKNDLMNRL